MRGKQKTVWYGPQACAVCGRQVVTSEGGLKIMEAIPEGQVYPNSEWVEHTHNEQPNN